MKMLPYACVSLLVAILTSGCEGGATANHATLAGSTAQPSPAPTPPPPFELVKRQLIPLAINICGWVDGEYSESISQHWGAERSARSLAPG